MGAVGALLGGGLGGALGQAIGGNQGGQAGQVIGGALGTIFPYFKKGGPVKKTGLAKVHKGEFVLPASVKPTKAQLAKVAKLHMK